MHPVCAVAALVLVLVWLGFVPPVPLSFRFARFLRCPRSFALSGDSFSAHAIGIGEPVRITRRPELPCMHLPYDAHLWVILVPTSVLHSRYIGGVVSL